MNNYKVLQNFIKSKWWAIIVEEIDQRIKDIEEVLLTPVSDLERLTQNTMTAEEKVNFINIKQKERENLIWIKSIPQELLNSEVIEQEL